MLVSMGATTQKGYVVRASSVGAAIKSRRAFLGIQAEDVVERTGGVISLKLLSALENNHRNPTSLTVGKYRLLLRALEMTPAEFEELTGVSAALPEPDDVPGARPFVPSLRIPIAGTVSAGLRGVDVTDVEERMMLDPSLPGLRGRSSKNLVVLVVTGDSMMSEQASQSIRNGAHVVVEVGALPTNGETVIAWLENHDTAVIKRYSEGPNTILRSLNPVGPVFRLGDEPFDIRGVVRTVIQTP